MAVFFKTFIGVLLLLVFALVIIFISRVSLIQILSPRIANQYGVDISQINISQFNMRDIQLPYLEVSQKIENGLLRIGVENLEIKTNLWNILAADVESIMAEKIIIDIEMDAASGETQAQEPSKTIKSLIESLPKFEANIAHLEIQYRDHNNQQLNFNGALKYSENLVEIDGSLDLPGYVKVNLEFSYSDGRAINMQVFGPTLNQKIVMLNGSVLDNQDLLNIDVAGQISLSDIAQVFAAYGYSSPIDITLDDSSIELTAALDVNDYLDRVFHNTSIAVAFASSLQARAYEYELANVDVEFATDCVVEMLAVVECVFAKPVKANIELEDNLSIVEELFAKNETNYLLQVNPENELFVKLNASDEAESLLSIMGDANIDIRSENEMLQLEVGLKDVNLDYVDALKGYARFSSAVKLMDMNAPMQIKQMSFDMAGEMNANNQALTIHVLKGGKLFLDDLSFDEALIQNVDLEFGSDFSAEYNFLNNGLNIQRAKIKLLPNGFGIADLEIEHDEVVLSFNNLSYLVGDATLNVDIDSDAFSLSQRDLSLEFATSGLEIALHKNELLINGEFGVDSQTSKFNVTGKYNIGQQQGVLNAEMKSFSPASSRLVSQAIADSGLPIAIDAGDVDIEMIANIQVENQQSKTDIWANMLVRSLEGNYAQNGFKDLNAEFEIYGSDGWELLAPALISVAEVNVGMPIKDLTLELDRYTQKTGQQAVIDIGEFRAQTLQGSIFAQNVLLDFNQSLNQFSIFLSRLSLEELIALNQNQDLIASGVFDGELPVMLSEQGFAINDGWIKADEQGGEIKYMRAEELLVGHPNLEIVAELLEDFQYNEMSADINLQPDGLVLLTTKLHGKSPESQFNSQVNINFNVELNVWKFLESLRLLTRIDQDIDKQIFHKGSSDLF